MSSNSKRHSFKDPKYKNTNPVKIIPLGGIGEIGKNMTAFEYNNDIIIVDCGMSFPEENMPGVDRTCPALTASSRISLISDATRRSSEASLSHTDTRITSALSPIS